MTPDVGEDLHKQLVTILFYYQRKTRAYLGLQTELADSLTVESRLLRGTGASKLNLQHKNPS